MLGIESSCDETAVAIIKFNKDNSGGKLLSHVVLSQIEDHKKFGGVFPEVASRLHLEKIEQVFKHAVNIAGIEYSDIDFVAATCGPGLIGSVVVGASFGKAVSVSLNRPFIAVNHLVGHALMPRFAHKSLEFPYLLVLVSGGHSIIGILHSPDNFEKLGSTIDDSAGECFDKVARMIDLPYPGGPNIEKIAALGNADKYEFPIPLNDRSCKLSFSGLKTAVLYKVNELKEENKGNLSIEQKSDIAASFQKTIVEVFRKKVVNALRGKKENLSHNKIKSIVFSGGVASNKAIRRMGEELAAKYKLQFFAPSIELCTDNGVMIAWAAIEMLRAKAHKKAKDSSDPKFNDLFDDLSCDIMKKNIFTEE